MPLTAAEMNRLEDAIFASCRVASKNGFKLLSIAASKAIFLADREYYLKNGQPLIADAYVHGKFGPYLLELREATRNLTDNGYVIVKDAFYTGCVQEFHEYHLGKRHNDYSIKTLDSAGVKLVECKTIEVLTNYIDVADAAMSTHNHAWRITSEKEPMPLNMQILTASLPITEDDLNWAQGILGGM